MQGGSGSFLLKYWFLITHEPPSNLQQVVLRLIQVNCCVSFTWISTPDPFRLIMGKLVCTSACVKDAAFFSRPGFALWNVSRMFRVLWTFAGFKIFQRGPLCAHFNEIFCGGYMQTASVGVFDAVLRR